MAIVLPILLHLTASAQPNCQIGIFSQSAPASPNTFIFAAYPLFDSTCFSPNSTYIWSFGDNATATGSNVTHVYNQPGNYLVCVTATTVFGFSVSSCDTIQVGGTSNCVAMFSYSQNNATITTNPTLIGSPSCFNVNTVLTWSWGDGTSSTSGLNQGSSHTYQNPGTYTVCLQVFTPGIAPMNSCMSVTINSSNPNSSIMGQVLVNGDCPTFPINVRLIAVNGPEDYSYTIPGIPSDSCLYYFTIPSNLPRAWVVRAEPQGSTSYLPTYFGDVLFYTDATLFATPQGFQFNQPINLIPNVYNDLPWDSLPPGLGVVTGNILGAGTVVTSVLGGHNVTATFQPENAQVIIFNAAGQPVAIAAVQANGSFTIPALPEGQYSIRVECPKIPSQAFNFELTAGNMNRNFQFNVNSTGINVVTSIKKSMAESGFAVSPNPAQSHISLYGFSGTVSIIDARGKVVLQTSDHRQINISGLPVGLYTLKGESKGGSGISTRFVKN